MQLTWQHYIQCALRVCMQNLLNGNVTRVSTLRYGDAKTLPAVDVHLKPGFDAVPLRLLPGLNVTYNTGASNHAMQCCQ